MNYLISYDIEDNKARNKIFDKLKDFGLKPIQKSVFYGNINKSDKLAIKALLNKYCNKQDKAILAQINLDFLDTIGYEKADFEEKDFEVI